MNLLAVLPEDAPLSVDKLTPREREVVTLLTTGMSQKQIAHALGIAPGTVRAHSTNAREKTGCFSTVQLAVKAAMT